MSIRVTVNSNHSSECNHRLLKDVETEKRNEWNRRRLLRIQQVRQQSKDFANSLREKIHGECDLQRENNNKQWQGKTLDRLTEKYRDCLKDIGLAHAKAARQPDPDEILREERLKNAVITGIRGESAMCLLKCKQQMKQLEETVPTRLKAYVRAKEDLRSTMIASLPQPQPRQKKSPIKKKFSPTKRRIVATKQKKPRHVLKEIPSNLPEDYVTVIKRAPDNDKMGKCCGGSNVINDDDDDDNNERERPESPKYKCHCSPKKTKTSEIQERKAAKTIQPSRKDDEAEGAACSTDARRQRRYSGEFPATSDVEGDNYDSDTTWPPRSRRSSSSGGNHVHCYDHCNRHHGSRTVTSCHVKRAVTDAEERSAAVRGVAAYEADLRASQCEAQSREERVRQQARRGEEALRRQQRRNDFDKLMLELSKLNREERKLRYTNWTKTSTELGDTQQKMATKIRQKKMESAFEMEFMEPIIEDEKKEPAGTPKLNVAEWKQSERTESIEVSREKQNDKLTLSNLMKRINEQRESLFQEIRNDTSDRDRAIGGTDKSDGKVPDRTDHSSIKKVSHSTTSNTQNSGAKYNPNDFTEHNVSNSRNSKRGEVGEPNTQQYGLDDGDSSRHKLPTVFGFEEIKLPRQSNQDRDDSSSKYLTTRDSSRQKTQYGGEDKETDGIKTLYEFEETKLPRHSTQYRDDSTKPDSQGAANNSNSRYRSVIEPPEPRTRRGPCFCGSTVDKFCKCSAKVDVVEEKKEDSSRAPIELRSSRVEEVSCLCGGNFRKQCVCSKNTDSVSERSKNVPTSSDYRRMNRNRLPSPILEVSETSYKQDSREVDDNETKERSDTKSGKVDKTVEKRNVGETVDKKSEKFSETVDKKPEKFNEKVEGEKNSDSSLSTLYSLDMALAQVAVENNDEKEDGPSTNMKGLRITVKVTGGKEFKDKKKKKSKNEEGTLLKECRKLLEDKGNVRKRNVSGETTSTSYRSPPEHLSPKQLQLLRDLLKQIESKPDEKGMPLLKRYILRLLSMNRESINCLGVSSSDVSLQSSLVREMVGDLEDSRNLDEDVTMKHASFEEKGVQVSLVESSTKNDNRKSSKVKDATSDRMEQKKISRIDKDGENTSVDKSGKQKRNKKMETEQQAYSSPPEDASMLDDLDVLTQQINKYFETKQNDKSDEIVKKYMELAKRYTDRISNLADLIGDVETDLPSSLIKSRTDEESSDSNKTSPADSQNRISPVESSHRSSLSPVGSQTYNETSYMTLPPEVKVPLPTRRVEPLERISPTFNQDKQRQDISWHEALSHPAPTRISPAPDEDKFFQIAFGSQRPKPPPTILNNNNNHLDPDLRTSSPHELSTIHEVDTPSTSWRRDMPQQMATSSPRKRSSLSDNVYPEFTGAGSWIPPPDESIPLDNTSPGRKQKVSDESFQTLKSDDHSGDEMDLGEKDILDESMPDVMQELIRRNIVSSPYGWLKEMQERERATQEMERASQERDRATQEMADEEVRRIMRESPEDLEAALKNLGIGWASTTLRKTRQAGELSGDSSSPPDVRAVGTTMETSTPQSGKPVAWPVVGSETEISAIRLIASSSSDMALTPPDISLKQPQLSLSSNSSKSKS